MLNVKIKTVLNCCFKGFVKSRNKTFQIQEIETSIRGIQSDWITMLFIIIFLTPKLIIEPRQNRLFVYAKTKTHISFAVTAKLISAFVFATRTVQSLYFLYTKFQASSHLVWLYSLVYFGPGGKPRRPVFSQRGSYVTGKPVC